MPKKPARSSSKRIPIWIGLILVGAVLGACRLLSPETVVTTPEPVLPAATNPVSVPTATLVPAVPTEASPTQVPPTLALPTLAPVLPTAVPVLPTQIPPLPTQPPPAPTHPDTLRLKMFMVAVGDNGQSGKAVGCGDSLIPVNIDVPYTQAVLRAALERLLAQDNQFYGQSGLSNALYQSDLRIDDLNIKDGEAIIRLSGAVTLGGECDTPRFIGQIEETALQFSTVQRVSVFLNGKPIREALSLR